MIPNYTKAFQVIGWSKIIKPEHRNASNNSDGGIFPTVEMAREYGDAGLHPGYEVREIENPTNRTVHAWALAYSMGWDMFAALRELERLESEAGE